MKTLTFFKRQNKVLIIGILSLLAGIVNGFLGTGGGILLMCALSLVPANSDNSVRDKFSQVIAIVLPLSLISVISYGESVNLESAAPYILPGILGGVCGAVLLDKLSVNFIKKLFAIMIIWAGINFLR